MHNLNSFLSLHWVALGRADKVHLYLQTFVLAPQCPNTKSFLLFQASLADNNTDVCLIGKKLFNGVDVSYSSDEQGSVPSTLLGVVVKMIWIFWM